jgi:Glycosyl transferase family 2
LAAQVARNLPSVALEYGATSQLAGTLDVFTRQMLSAPASGADMAALCEAFNSKAWAKENTISVGVSSSAQHVTPDVSQVVAPPATVERFSRRLTVGMATFDDFDGVYFTIQSLRMNHPELHGALEFLIVDNNPGGPCSEALANFSKAVDGCRYLPRGDWNGTAIRNVVFEEASSPFVLCIDSHVLIAPGALTKLIAFFELQPDARDLLQGPLVYDDLRSVATHFEPCWRAGMYGTWAEDPRGADPLAPCFDIPMQGLGLFACARAAWPGFNPKFRGFGGEEGYIHVKARRRGGRTLCLPFLRWAHRFNRPLGTQYVNRWEDRMRNYFIGFTELGLDTSEMEAHFAELLGDATAKRIFIAIKQEAGLAREQERVG